MGKDGAETHAVPKVEPRQGEAKTRYLGRQISLLGTALVMESDSLDPTKDDILGNFPTQTLQDRYQHTGSLEVPHDLVHTCQQRTPG